MSYINVNTERIDNAHLTALIRVFRAAGRSMPERAAGRFLHELARDLDQELNIRRSWGFRTAGQRSIQLPSAGEMNIPELQVLMGFLWDSAAEFLSIDRPEVAAIFVATGELCRIFLALRGVESGHDLG